MKKKLLLQDISDYLAQHEGISKKDADTFVRAFFEVIEQGLLEENFVKIKGLGTFKLVTVSERESVNINTGERFQISSHTKVTFTPDNNMKELVNRPFAHFETVDLSDDTSMTELEQIDQEMQETLNDEDTDNETEEETEETTETDAATDDAPPAGTETEDADSETAPTTAETEDADSETAPTTAETEDEPELEVSAPQPAVKQDEAEEEETAGQETDNGMPAAMEVTVAEEDDEVAETDNGEANAPCEAQPTPAEEANGPQPAETEAAETTAAPAAASDVTETAEKAETAANGTKEEEIIVTHPQTIHSCTDEEAVRSLDKANPTLSYTYREVPAPRKHNWWKTTALTCLVILLMGISYFAGYFKVLCPCSYPILENWLTPYLTEKPATPAAAAPATCPQTPARKDAEGLPQTDAAATEDSAPKAAEEKTGTEDTAPAQTDAPAEKPVSPAEKAEEKQPKTPSETEKPAEKADEKQPEKPRTHVVKRGDNLSKIARRYYGSDKYVRAIMKRNKLKDADNIELGMTLYLP